MKKISNIIFAAACLLVVAFFILRTWTKSFSPYEKLEAKLNKLEVSIDYCKPTMKGRNIFGELIPYDIVWRTGANEATIIKFTKNCFFGGKNIKKGEYSLWSIPSKNDDWTIILNSETGQWGTNYDPQKDYIRLKVKTERILPAVEQLTIKLVENNDLINFSLAWENTLINIPIR
jgi:Protein of unknown function (DUF2911)